MIRVLIVDDHTLVRAGLCRLLESEADIKVIGESGLGHEAIALCAELEPDGEELSEKSIRDLSLSPLRRRFEDSSGVVWIAHPVEGGRAKGAKSVFRVSLHSLEHGSKVVDLPPGRTLGDLKDKELVALV